MQTQTGHEPKSVKRLNATLPEPLARFVGEVTGDGGLYETPSEFVRDLIRRYMESTQKSHYAELNAMLVRSLKTDSYSAWTQQDMQDIIDDIEA